MRRRQRQFSFAVSHGRLVRQVRLQDGRGYTQHCTLDVLTQVAGLLEQCRQTGITTNELWEALPELPCTQISIALAFLKDRGGVETTARRNYPASTTLVEDVLTEFHYLAHRAEE